MLQDFLAHQYAVTAKLGIDEMHFVLALVDRTPDFQDVERLRFVCRVPDRTHHFDAFVDGNAFVRAKVKWQELFCLLLCMSSTVMDRRSVDPCACKKERQNSKFFHLS